MDDWQDKVWGRTRCTCESPFYSRHELEVIAKGFTSVHFHKARANRFIVHSGRIAVVEFFAWTVRRTILGPDNIYDVPSLVVHQFQVEESGTVTEEYWPDRGGQVSNSDIVRIMEGGTVDDVGKFASLIARMKSNYVAA